jgi:hypothetical protein
MEYALHFWTDEVEVLLPNPRKNTAKTSGHYV